MAENPLHQYANYTYKLELWACKSDSFNSGSGKGDELLITDGGIANDGNTFKVSFSLDNLEIETIIGGMGQNGFAADALTIKFDIIEPYTVTLLEKLAKVAKDNTESGDIKTLIYMLNIKFIGYNDGGYGGPQEIDIPNKYFYFSIFSINFNVTHRGAIYHVEGIATKALPMLAVLDNVIPTQVELQGKTVNDIFGSGGGGLGDTSIAGGGFEDKPDIKDLKSHLYKWENEKLDKEKQDIANEYSFEFDEEFGNAKIIDINQILKPNSTIPSSNLKAKETLKQGQSGKIEIDTEKGIVKAFAGTRIVDFIGKVLTNTDYMESQVGKTDGSFVGWKIWPKLEVLKYDKKVQFFARKVTYKVEKYEYKGLDHPQFGQAPPDNIVKTYNYIFTGMNKDVIKANLDYHMAYFEVKTIDSTTKNQPGNNQLSAIITNSAGIATRTAPNVTPESSTVAEMITRLLSSGVDMMALDLEIVGDPDWILQDTEEDIKYRNQDVNFKFNFKTATKDYNDSTGIFDVESADTAFFGGIYKVISVKSMFRKGKFTQTLSNVRTRVQPPDGN
jgi:hypothetical protein